MTFYTPTTDEKVMFLIIEYQSVSMERKQRPFLVDADLVPALRILGNFHPRVRQRPEAFAPVLRRRHPGTGASREVRLPVIVSVLKKSDDPLATASNLGLILDLCVEEAKIMSRVPKNGNQGDCRSENWISGVDQNEIERFEVDQVEKSQEASAEMISAEQVKKDIEEFKRRKGIVTDVRQHNDEAVDRIFRSGVRQVPDPSQR